MQEAVIRKKYGGLLLRKTPLISKVVSLIFSSFFPSPFSQLLWVCGSSYKLPDHMQDHDRAFFDSADWALGKVFTKILLNPD